MRISRLAFVPLLAACLAPPASGQVREVKGSSPARAAKAVDAVRTIEIVGTDDMKYSVTRIVAKRGEQLRIRLISKGTLPRIAMAHNVVVLKPETAVQKFIDAGATFRTTDFIAPAMTSSVLAQTRFAGPGETVEVRFKLPAKAGTYPFVCTFAGHYAAGMKGTIVVK